MNARAAHNGGNDRRRRGRCRRTRRQGALAALAAAALWLAGAEEAPAEAIQMMSVSGLSTLNTHTEGLAFGANFTTGPHPEGYRVTSMTIYFVGQCQRTPRGSKVQGSKATKTRDW